MIHCGRGYDVSHSLSVNAEFLVARQAVICVITDGTVQLSFDISGYRPKLYSFDNN